MPFIPYPEFFIPVAIFGAFVLVSWILKLGLDRYLVKLAEETETELDDIFIESLRTPFLIIFVAAGAEIASRYATLPAGVGAWIHPLLYLAIGLAALGGTIKFISGVLKYYGEKFPGLKPLVPTLDKIIKLAVGIIGLMIILAWLGISISPLLMSFGVGGLAVALALRNTLQNFFAGLSMMMERRITVGDYVELESGEKGYVTDISWRTTRVKMLPDNIVVIPNSKLSQSIITNYHSPQEEMSTYIKVGVSYDSDLREVEEVTLEVAKRTLEEVEGGVEDFEPFLRYDEFDDFSINFTVVLRVKEYRDKYAITTEFIKSLKEKYDEEEIEIPFPIQTIRWEEGEGPVMREKSAS